MHEDTNETTTEIINGWVKTTQTIITYQEQPNRIDQLLQSKQVNVDQINSIDQELENLGYEG